MALFEALPGLQIESPLVTPQAANFLPSTWPPTDDFPVVIDADGVIVSRYGEPTWNVAPWAGKGLKLSFGGADISKGAKVSSGNAALLRQIAGWWLWGPNAARSASGLASRIKRIKPLFVLCTEAGILASDLSRFPRVVEQVPSRLSAANVNQAFSLLHDLWTVRDTLGFQLLDERQLRELSGQLPKYEPTQTAYIPPRIWTYQLRRLRECLDEFLSHRVQVEDCFRFCLSAYALDAEPDQKYKPFEPTIPAGHVSADGRRYHGRFRLTAERFGIDALLDRWVESSDIVGVKAISTYLSLISQAGLAYVLNYSLMRIDEGMKLRANCYSVERDTLGDDIHLLCGATTKTVQDDDARWIVSPSAEVAIEAMVVVAKLRLEVARHSPHLKLDRADLDNPLLQGRSNEPWSATAGKTIKMRKKTRSYAELVGRFPKLFDLEQLRITEADLAIANRMTFGLNPEEFAVGKIWQLAWHQLRRTGACNMLSTGLVAESSLQYQLKHATRAMSRYYGQNHYKLKASLDDETRGFYLREMYEALAREFKALQDDRHVSPHGERRKAQILAPISEKDHKALVTDARSGCISYRETFLGGCARQGPTCPLGGISNITGCMGHGSEGACEWVILDRAKRPVVDALRESFRMQLRQAPADSPLEASLLASLESAERAINAIDTI